MAAERWQQSEFVALWRILSSQMSVSGAVMTVRIGGCQCYGDGKGCFGVVVDMGQEGEAGVKDDSTYF